MTTDAQQLGRYELVKRIAVGGMGEIYLAKSRGAAGFEKTVIIKKILAHLAEEKEFVTKFLDEGRIVVNLTHGNIVPVFDMGEEDGEYFIAMDYVPGRDLRDILKRLKANGRTMPVSLAVHIVTEACKGLDYAHKRTDDQGNPLGIVHRDISPSNILVSSEGEVKVIDFGIARAAGRLSQTVSGRIQGKCCYMSPEQARGRAIDHRSDIFSTGVVLYEMLTGIRPFEGDSDLHSLDLVRRCQFDAPSDHNPEVPDELDAIVAKALSKDVDQRYQSIDQLHVELLEFLYKRGRAIVGQQLGEFLRELFPEGLERDELRRARESKPSGPKNLDEALEAELAKLEQADQPKAGINPLAATATDMASADGPGTATLGVAATATDRANPTPTTVPEPVGDEDGGQGGAPTDSVDQGRDGSVSGLVDAAQTSGSNTWETARQPDEPTGFKRWIAIGTVVGVLAGAWAIWYFLTVKSYGEVFIDSQPPGAQIYVDDSVVAGKQTPATLELEVGDHRIRLEKAGYEPRRLAVEVVGGKAQRITGQETVLAARAPEPTPHAEPIKVFVETRPPDATVVLDNGEAFTKPGPLTLEPGEPRYLRASHPDCQETSRAITYEAYAHADSPLVRLELDCPELAQSPDTGADTGRADDKPAATPSPYRWVTIRTEPAEATLFIDGESAGQSSVRRRFGRDDRVELRAEAPGYEPATRTVDVGRLGTSRLTLSLEKRKMGCLTFRLWNPQIGQIAVDGTVVKSDARSSGRLELPVGTHEVSAMNEVAPTDTHTVKIEPGDDCQHVVFWDAAGSPAKN